MNFEITGLNALMLVALCLPGFFLTKANVLKEEHIKGFAVFLLYVCSPALSIYSFQQAECNMEILINIGILLLVTTFMQVLIMGIGFLINIKTYKIDGASRVATVAAAFGNVGFFGVPILQALLPDHPEAMVYSAVMSVMMNLIGWTLGMFMMSGDRKHVSVKNFLINPTTLCLLIALPLFFTNTSLPKPVMNFVEFFSKMSTPTAMTVLGMRLAFVKFRDLMDYRQVVAIFLKLIALPLITFGIMYALPVDETLKISTYILSCMPPAAITLNFAELSNTSPKTAANIVVVGSLLVAITLPVLLLIA
ncbi:MAG: AEC family transporter [Eubacteriales bacterium]|jgi:predicted permease|nr:AEC family transporter [Clostridiales bacterium]MDY2683420.1 AEC family transporter [Eubacteriales bacterium]MEE0399864.1 AEC family transporter [Christensenellales bacterium]MCI6183787.1 AEC family transporter [Clostridiales bacterium]MCI6215239.1 AEC family transporter [Clostridiales bacterium]